LSEPRNREFEDEDDNENEDDAGVLPSTADKLSALLWLDPATAAMNNFG
jgi:hypothetical protein